MRTISLPFPLQLHGYGDLRGQSAGPLLPPYALDTAVKKLISHDDTNERCSIALLTAVRQRFTATVRIQILQNTDYSKNGFCICNFYDIGLNVVQPELYKYVGGYKMGATGA